MDYCLFEWVLNLRSRVPGALPKSPWVPIAAGPPSPSGCWSGLRPRRAPSMAYERTRTILSSNWRTTERQRSHVSDKSCSRSANSAKDPRGARWRCSPLPIAVVLGAVFLRLNNSR